MLTFIVVDDKNEIRNQEIKVIDSYMMNFDIKYKIKEYSEYNSDFEKDVKKVTGQKIYLLDIMTDNGSGIDATRMIREEYNDWQSTIIIITAYPEYKYEALGARLYILDFITKADSFTKRLKEGIGIALDNYHKKPNTISYKYNSYINIIDYKDIIYIEKEPDSKRCTIHTTSGDEKIPKGLTELEKELDNRFFRTHRSLIVNTDKIKRFDYQQNCIIFKNGEYTELVSRNKKKDLMEHLTNK